MLKRLDIHNKLPNGTQNRRLFLMNYQILMGKKVKDTSINISKDIYTDSDTSLYSTCIIVAINKQTSEILQTT